MSKFFIRSSNFTFHLKNFCEKFFNLDKTQFFYDFLRSTPAADHKSNVLKITTSVT